MRSLRYLKMMALAVAVIPAAPVLAVMLPSSTMTLTTPDSTYNTLSMTVGLSFGFGTQYQTQSPTITGSCSTTFNAVFDPTNRQATIQDVTFDLQQPGQVSLQDETFGPYFGLEIISTSGVLGSPYMPSPPSAVGGGLFPADETSMSLNGGYLIFSGYYAGSANLSSSAINTSNNPHSLATVAVSAPAMSGSVATYTATVIVPLSLSQTVIGPGYTAPIDATGTMQATGSFQFDFGPQTVNWNAASGDFSGSGNWDVGFAPRTSDTASIANGGSSTLSSTFSAVPAAVWLGNGPSTSGTLTIASGGSLGCGAIVLGQSGGSGMLYFSGGTLAAAAGNSQFLTGPGTAYVSTSGATINSNGFNVTIGAGLQHDPAFGPTPDGGLLKIGAGKLVLSGTDNYTGGTTVEGGTLIVMQSAGLADRSNLTVGKPSLFGTATSAAAAGGVPAAPAAAPVPEPATLALLAAGLCGAAWTSYRRRAAASSVKGQYPRDAAEVPAYAFGSDGLGTGAVSSG